MYLISGSDPAKVQLPYFPPEFHQIRHQPYPLPTDFENVPDFRFRPVQSATSFLPERFSKNLTPTLPFDNQFRNCTWFQVQACPKYNFLIPRPIFTKFDTNRTLCKQILKMYLIAGSDLSKLKLPYFPTDFHQMRHQPSPCQLISKMYLISGSDLSKMQLHYSSTNFQEIDTNLILCQQISKINPISGSDLCKVQLPYSPTDFQLILNQLHPLPTDYEKVF